MTYEAPQIIDYGDLVKLTEAVQDLGSVDGSYHASA